MTTIASLSDLSDASLLTQAERLAAASRASTSDLVATLAELDRRRLYLGLGYSSLFVYCTSRLHLTEGEAFNRIEAARAVRRFPALLPHLAAGSLGLTAIRLLAPHLTPDNYDGVVKAAEFQGTRAIERLVAELRPQPPVPSSVRKLPATKAADENATSTLALTAQTGMMHAQVVSVPAQVPASHRPVVKPLSAEHYKIQVTFNVGAHDKLRRAQSLMRHQIPSGDPAIVLDRALDALLRELEKAKCAHVTRPRAAGGRDSRTRHIPSHVKREVWKRDGARCAFARADGRRCDEANFLEYHHVVPYARGGRATVDNIELRCRAHNAYEAERDFGWLVKEDRPGYDARPA